MGTKRDEFVCMFEKKHGDNPSKYVSDPKLFAGMLNKDPELRSAFRDAVDEKKAGPSDEEAAAGLANLFGGM